MLFPLSSMTMNHTVSEFKQIRPDQVDPAIGYGRYASVSRITGINFAIKVPLGTRSHHTLVERSIYERLGEHHLILKYYQPAVYISGGRPIDGLLFQFLEAGTLAENLNAHRWIGNKIQYATYLAIYSIIC